MDTTPHLSRIEYLILYLLLDGGEMYGLQMTRKGYIKIGTVYTTLRRMADKGLVESRQLSRLQLYRATDHGRAVFQALETAREQVEQAGRQHQVGT